MYYEWVDKKKQGLQVMSKTFDKKKKSTIGKRQKGSLQTRGQR